MKKIINIASHVLIVLTLTAINVVALFKLLCSYDSLVIVFAMYIVLVFIPSALAAFSLGFILDSKNKND